MKLLVAFTPL